MAVTSKFGQIIILNGTPRSGKTSIAHVVRETFDGLWVNIGVDPFKERIHPKRYSPGIGLRPGGEGPDLESIVVMLYAAMYESIAAHSRLGLNVVVDVGHHDCYSKPLGILPSCAQRLDGFPVLFVGVRCPIEVIMERRRNTWGSGDAENDSIPDPIRRWQREVHRPGIYDLNVDTSALSPDECAEAILKHLREGPAPTAFKQLAEMTVDGAEQ
jgi:chloramphenicol 3-O phosphotransferase